MHCAVVGGDDALHDRQAEPGPRLFGCVVPLKYSWEMLFLDPRTCIPDFYRQIVLLPVRGLFDQPLDSQGTSVGHGIDRVDEQIEKNLHYLVLVENHLPVDVFEVGTVCDSVLEEIRAD